MTNLTRVAAHEEVGICFSLLLFMLTQDGFDLLLERYTILYERSIKKLKEKQKDPKAKEKEDPDGIVDEFGVTPEEMSVAPKILAKRKLQAIRKLLEKLLAFDAWCQNGPLWSLGEDDGKGGQVRADEGINKMLEELKLIVPRKDGNGWCIQKFHELKHLPKNITIFGHSRNFDTGHLESHLKVAAKKPAKTAQKRSLREFQEQVGKRVDDFQFMAKVKNDMGIIPDGVTRAKEHFEYQKRVREQVGERDSDVVLRSRLCTYTPRPKFLVPNKPPSELNYEQKIHVTHKVDYFPGFA